MISPRAEGSRCRRPTANTCEATLDASALPRRLASPHTVTSAAMCSSWSDLVSVSEWQRIPCPDYPVAGRKFQRHPTGSSLSPQTTLKRKPVRKKSTGFDPSAELGDGRRALMGWTIIGAPHEAGEGMRNRKDVPVSLLVLLWNLAGLGVSTAWAQPPDVVLINGRIVTLDQRSSIQQAMAVRDGKVVALGDTAG